MSWFTKSFAMGEEEEEEDEEEEEEEEEEDDDDSLNLAAIASATGATVKEDLSKLKETFTRQLWGVASFLAPPPPERASDSGSTTGGDGDVARGKGSTDERSNDADTRNPSVTTLRESGEKFGGDGFPDVEANFPAVIELEKSVPITDRSDARGIATFQGAVAENVVPEQNRGPERPRLTGLRNDFAELKGTMVTGLSRLSNVVRVVVRDDVNGEEDEKRLLFMTTGENTHSLSSLGADGDQRTSSPRLGFDSFLKPLFGNVLMGEGASSDAAKVGVHAGEGEGADSSTHIEQSYGEIDSMQRELELIPSAIASGIDGLSKFAASLLNIVGDDEDQVKKDEFEGRNPALGLTEAVVTFARNVAMHPETWLDFPLPESDNEFELTDAQKDHVQALKDVAPGLEALKVELCPNYMTEERFWKIYFVLISRLSSSESPMLSTRQVVRARTTMLEELQRGVPQGGVLDASQDSAGSEQTVSDGFGARQESKYLEYGFGHNLSPSSAMVRTSRTSSTSSISDTRQPGEVSATDRSAVGSAGEARAVQYHPEPGRGRFSMDNKSNMEDDAEVDEWLDEEDSSTPKQHGAAGAGGAPQGHLAAVSHINDDEEVSFSDLEEDESSSRVTRTRGTVASSSPKSSGSGVAPDGAPTVPADASGSSTQGDSTPRKSSEFNDWLTVNQDDVDSGGSSSP